jgi:type II secretory pathway pseudopilin PulG
MPLQALVVASIPWTDEVTALATLGLAVLTFLLVIAAVIAAALTKRSIGVQLKAATEDLQATREATRAAQDAAQLQIEAEHRPLLIDVARYGAHPHDLSSGTQVLLDFPGGHTTIIDPRAVYVGTGGGRIFIAVPLRNVGRGLATIDPDAVTAHGPHVGRRLACEVQRERVPVGESTRILCAYESIAQAEPPELWTYHVWVPYRDFAEGQLIVAAVRIEGQKSDWQVRDVKQVQPGDIAPLS